MIPISAALAVISNKQIGRPVPAAGRQVLLRRYLVSAMCAEQALEESFVTCTLLSYDWSGISQMYMRHPPLVVQQVPTYDAYVPQKQVGWQVAVGTSRYIRAPLKKPPPRNRLFGKTANDRPFKSQIGCYSHFFLVEIRNGGKAGNFGVALSPGVIPRGGGPVFRLGSRKVIACPRDLVLCC